MDLDRNEVIFLHQFRQVLTEFLHRLACRGPAPEPLDNVVTISRLLPDVIVSQHILYKGNKPDVSEGSQTEDGHDYEQEKAEKIHVPLPPDEQEDRYPN